MPTFIDQTLHQLRLENKPVRIVSLVPSQSELLWDLGLRAELVGITKFCIHPDEMYRTVTRVGGTKNLDIEKIRGLKPDLIIGNKEENEKDQIELLRREFPVWVSDINSIEDSLQMIRRVGELVQKQSESENIASSVEMGLSEMKNIFNRQRVLYLIWKDPFMAAGGNTFINSVLSFAGLANVAEQVNRYPEFTIEQMRNLKPDYCFLSSEPYPFSEKHIKELSRVLPETEIRLVDGEMFSWYGSRLLLLPDYMQKLKKEISS